jgi:hypothetical protein
LEHDGGYCCKENNDDGGNWSYWILILMNLMSY